MDISNRRAGYLANLENIPPLIFRFQFNPEELSDKKSFTYEAVNSFGQWGFDQTAAGTGFIGTLAGLLKDAKEIGSLLVATKPLEPKGGELRTISLDFVLDGRIPGPKDGDSHFKGSIEPDLAILRSFMYPSLDLFDVASFIGSGFKDKPCWNRPPECSLTYGGISLTCVMTDLSIKITAFSDLGEPQRAEVSVTLKEQTLSLSPIFDFIKRNVNAARALGRDNLTEDLKIASGVQGLLDLFG